MAATPQPKPAQVGIDLGLTTFATLSTAEKVNKPQHLHRSQRRLQIRQRRLSRKRRASNNRDKARHRVAIQHERIANQRRDFHHKLRRRLADGYDPIGKVGQFFLSSRLCSDCGEKNDSLRRSMRRYVAMLRERSGGASTTSAISTRSPQLPWPKRVPPGQPITFPRIAPVAAYKACV
jgi:transposase